MVQMDGPCQHEVDSTLHSCNRRSGSGAKTWNLSNSEVGRLKHTYLPTFVRCCLVLCRIEEWLLPSGQQSMSQLGIAGPIYRWVAPYWVVHYNVTPILTGSSSSWCWHVLVRSRRSEPAATRTWFHVQDLAVSGLLSLLPPWWKPVAQTRGVFKGP